MSKKFKKQYAEILQKKATNYNESVIYNDSDLQKINAGAVDSDYQSNEDDDNFRSPDDYNDIYGQYGDNNSSKDGGLIMTGRHSKNGNGSLQSIHSSRHSGNSSIQ